MEQASSALQNFLILFVADLGLPCKHFQCCLHLKLIFSALIPSRAQFHSAGQEPGYCRRWDSACGRKADKKDVATMEEKAVKT